MCKFHQFFNCYLLRLVNLIKPTLLDVYTEMGLLSCLRLAVLPLNEKLWISPFISTKCCLFFITYRYATASARSDGMVLLCGGRDSSGAVWSSLINSLIPLLWKEKDSRFFGFYVQMISREINWFVCKWCYQIKGKTLKSRMAKSYA